MRTRVISAIVALAIFIPLFLIGGNFYNIAIYILSIMGLKEFIEVKETKKNLLPFIKFISYMLISLIVFSNPSNSGMLFLIDFRIIAGLFLALLLPVVLYHDREKYSVNDAFYLIGGIFFLGVAFNLMILLRSRSLDLLVYLFLITTFTDTYAYLTGMLIGRNKLLEAISPKKTWEGLIGGTIFGVMISSVFYHVVIDSTISLNALLLMSTFLSIIGQFGDLFFSAIKRYYGKKDFSNLMPGHGGVLDRLDSLIFVILGFMFFISII